ncbi:MAG: putative PEP-binding protein, partial [Rhizobiaceae bacterium]
TDHGGRTSHAAIVAREMGVPAILGTGNATEVLQSGQPVTLACAQRDTGTVHEGHAKIESNALKLDSIPPTRTKVMLNLTNPAAAFSWHSLPSDGVGLARLEFILANTIAIHPMAALYPDRIGSMRARKQIEKLATGFESPAEYFLDCLAHALAQLAASVFPKRVIVRTSDFKSNEYAGLVGGKDFEGEEANPMIGWRGASRYYSEEFREAFDLECAAIAHARGVIGLDNIDVMIPFCRTLNEADRVLEILADNGLNRGESGLRTLVMCELPSNVVLAKRFAQRFDGLSIGSNDLTQLTLGIDRDSENLAHIFEEDDPAVRWMIRHAIEECHSAGSSIGLCGEAPSKDPAFAEFLVECGIDTISVSPESFIDVKSHVAKAETGLRSN